VKRRDHLAAYNRWGGQSLYSSRTGRFADRFPGGIVRPPVPGSGMRGSRRLSDLQTAFVRFAEQSGLPLGATRRRRPPRQSAPSRRRPGHDHPSVMTNTGHRQRAHATKRSRPGGKSGIPGLATKSTGTFGRAQRARANRVEVTTNPSPKTRESYRPNGGHHTVALAAMSRAGKRPVRQLLPVGQPDPRRHDRR